VGAGASQSLQRTCPPSDLKPPMRIHLLKVPEPLPILSWGPRSATWASGGHCSHPNHSSPCTKGRMAQAHLPSITPALEGWSSWVPKHPEWIFYPTTSLNLNSGFILSFLWKLASQLTTLL
jgi:hypothetical protein